LRGRNPLSITRHLHGKTHAHIVDVNPATQVVTLKGPQRTVELKVKDPEQFKLVRKGDQVEATFTEAVAIALTSAAKPAEAKK
jgi:hypothetical protein